MLYSRSGHVVAVFFCLQGTAVLRFQDVIPYRARCNINRLKNKNLAHHKQRRMYPLAVLTPSLLPLVLHVLFY